MDFAYDERTEELRVELADFMESQVYPAERDFEPTEPGGPHSWERPAVMAALKAEARRRGLWNLSCRTPRWEPDCRTCSMPLSPR